MSQTDRPLYATDALWWMSLLRGGERRLQRAPSVLRKGLHRSRRSLNTAPAAAAASATKRRLRGYRRNLRCSSCTVFGGSTIHPSSCRRCRPSVIETEINKHSLWGRPSVGPSSVQPRVLLRCLLLLLLAYPYPYSAPRPRPRRRATEPQLVPPVHERIARTIS